MKTPQIINAKDCFAALKAAREAAEREAEEAETANRKTMKQRLSL